MNIINELDKELEELHLSRPIYIASIKDARVVAEIHKNNCVSLASGYTAMQDIPTSDLKELADKLNVPLDEIRKREDKLFSNTRYVS